MDNVPFPDKAFGSTFSSGASSSERETPENATSWSGRDKAYTHKVNPRDAAQTVNDEGSARAGQSVSGSDGRHAHTIGILKLRAEHDTDPTDWWFASTAIPLIAATFAPMANMLSIAALVVYWRNDVTTLNDSLNIYKDSVGVEDPRWCLYLNAASLACGFIGNIFLLLNFTRRVRYIIALPLTIIFFYIACGILTAITVCMEIYTPAGPDQVYSQGYWHAIIAACLYMFNSMLLMVNMGGYFLGHYPQNFTLNDEHRNLILQTMLFFVWLAGGAGVFARTEIWNYPDALYFCDVTILTIGFGDYYAQDDLAKGLVFPYSVGGTIILGLMVSSIHKFARELSTEKVIRKHVETRRVDTLSRAVTIDELDDHRLTQLATGQKLNISRPVEQDSQRIQHDLNKLARAETLKRRTIQFDTTNQSGQVDQEVVSEAGPLPSQFVGGKSGGDGVILKSLRTLTFPIVKPVMMTTDGLRRVLTKGQKHILMLEERDRFNAMRAVQQNAHTFKRYYALTISIICFSMLWCLGAMVFYFAEKHTQGLNYFECLYFCYVSLLTIGYGDLSPRSNAGKAFFVVWSLIAVPTMTILVSDLGDTLIGGFKRGVLQNDLGLTSQSHNKESPSSWRSYLARLFRARSRITTRNNGNASGKPWQLGVERRKSSDSQGDGRRRSDGEQSRTIEDLANEDVSDSEMMRRLAFAIRQTAGDLKKDPSKKYSYEEWAQFSRLIKFSKFDKRKIQSGEASAAEQLEYDEAADGVVEWDWLDAKSPMTSEQSESEWILDRLCESLLRVFKKSDLVLGCLPRGEVTKQAGLSDQDHFDEADGDQVQRYRFVAGEDEAVPGLPLTRKMSRGHESSPTMSKKMSRFWKGDEAERQSPQWSKRARTKMAASQALEEAGPRTTPPARRRSSTAISQRHGSFTPGADD